MEAEKKSKEWKIVKVETLQNERVWAIKSESNPNGFNRAYWNHGKIALYYGKFKVLLDSVNVMVTEEEVVEAK